jgi:hypothetical protein
MSQRVFLSAVAASAIVLGAFVTGVRVGQRSPQNVGSASAARPSNRADCIAAASRAPTREGVMVMVDYCNDTFPSPPPGLVFEDDVVPRAR